MWCQIDLVHWEKRRKKNLSEVELHSYRLLLCLSQNCRYSLKPARELSHSEGSCLCCVQKRAPSHVPSELESSRQLQQDGLEMCGCVTGKWESRRHSHCGNNPKKFCVCRAQSSCPAGNGRAGVQIVWVTNPPSPHKAPGLLHEIVVKFGSLHCCQSHPCGVFIPHSVFISPLLCPGYSQAFFLQGKPLLPPFCCSCPALGTGWVGVPLLPCLVLSSRCHFTLGQLRKEVWMDFMLI